jgi:phage replication O-like protein O
MAEKGYTQIPNNTLEALYRLPQSATQLKILLVVIRYTLGFHRTEHSISEGFISKATGISKRYISGEIKKLINSNILKISKEASYTESRIIEFNCNIEEWDSRTILQQMNNTSTVEQSFNTSVEQSFHTPQNKNESQTCENHSKIGTFDGETNDSSTVEQDFYQERNLLKKSLKKNINKE